MKKPKKQKLIPSAKPQALDFRHLVAIVHQTHDTLKRRATMAVNTALVVRNWLIGYYLVEFEQHGADRAVYGNRVVRRLADTLLKEGVYGLSYRSLELSKKFFIAYRSIVQTPSAQSPNESPLSAQTVQLSPAQSKHSVERGVNSNQALSDQLARQFPLTWSQYAFLVQIQDMPERRFYEIESARENWALRELKRQFNSGLYERLALSRDKTKVRGLSRQGQVMLEPADAIKDPYVLEFLGLKEHPTFSESDLEQAIIDRLEHFLLELGKGFLFQARQYRLSFDDKHFWVDLVFYNRLLRCFVLMDLKIGELAHQDMGQMQMYVNYFDRKVKTKDEAPTVGIVLCKTKNDAVVEMTLPKGNRTIFASRYQLYLPSKAELRSQILQSEDPLQS